MRIPVGKVPSYGAIPKYGDLTTDGSCLSHLDSQPLFICLLSSQQHFKDRDYTVLCHQCLAQGVAPTWCTRRVCGPLEGTNGCPHGWDQVGSWSNQLYPCALTLSYSLCHLSSGTFRRLSAPLFLASHSCSWGSGFFESIPQTRAPPRPHFDSLASCSDNHRNCKDVGFNP